MFVRIFSLLKIVLLGLFIIVPATIYSQQKDSVSAIDSSLISRPKAISLTNIIQSSEEVKEEMEDEDMMDKYATKEDLAKAMAEVKGMIEELTAQKEELEVPTELSNQEPAVEPLSHSPEAEVSKKPTQLFAQNRSKSTLDKVMSKITNN